MDATTMEDFALDNEPSTKNSLVDLYLNTLSRTLSGLILDDPGYLPSIDPELKVETNLHYRSVGMDWPVRAQTMIGLARLNNLKYCVSEVLTNSIPGDFVETGVWRGGACIFMRAILAANAVTDRKVWVCDSFEGLPPPNVAQYPNDLGDSLHTVKFLAVSLEEVRHNFAKYGMLDEQVVFLKGFFKDTLPTAPISQVAIARLDGDMYESTIQAIEALYPKLSSGGFLIVDDFSLPPCRMAVEDYRSKTGISEEIQNIDNSSCFWRKQ